jgi:hypothetical protein
MRKRRPNWWMLYALIPAMPILFLIEGRIPESALEHRLMEFGIVLFVFGLIALWVHANESALIEEEMTDVKWSTVWDSEDGPERLPLVDFKADTEETKAEPNLPSVLKKDN